jgi:4-hydroxy-tetrahydrodipicolinate synthase
VVDFGRVLTAMVTPFDDEGNVDYEQAKKLALALLASGSDGVIVAGTTGESPTLSRDEKLRLFAELKSAVGDRGSVVAGTGSYDTRESLALTREAERSGVDAALLVVPYYNKPTQEGLLQHFTTIAGGTSLPCILYNVPSRTITNLMPETVIELSRVDNIVAIKEASGDLDQAARIIDGTASDFLLYSGNDGDTLELMSRGGFGVISVASHIVGNQVKAMVAKAGDGKTAEAADIDRALAPLFKALFVITNPMPIKHALNHLGFRVGNPRLPLTPPDEKSAATIEAELKRHTIDLPLG